MDETIERIVRGSRSRALRQGEAVPIHERIPKRKAKA